MIVLSAFDGISCGQLALHRANINIDMYFSSEIDKSSIEITQNNYKNTIQLGDIRTLRGSELPTIDLLIGGSPCQGFSFAGKQLNFSDPRSVLFFEFVRLLNECRPRYFLLENVNMKQEWKNTITQFLGVQPIRINSSLISAARRDRLYWTNIPNVALPIDKHITFDNINTHDTNWLPNTTISRIRSWKAHQKPLKNATIIGNGEKLPCLTARGYNQYHSGMILITDGTRYRYLTTTEAELAQTLPVGYTKGVVDKERSKCIGNCWTVDVISHIFKYLE